MEIKLVQTRIGGPKVIGQLPHDAGLRWSSIDRQPTDAEQIYLTWAGLKGDQCTETKPKPEGNGSIHGGNDKAVYVFPQSHYALWTQELGYEGMGDRSFGENWVIDGVVESEVCIGDIWSIGDAQLMVSKVRTPCATLNAYYNGQPMVRRMRDNGLCGWYLQVIRPGLVPTSGLITVTHPEVRGVTVAEMFAKKMGIVAA